MYVCEQSDRVCEMKLTLYNGVKCHQKRLLLLILVDA